jgi:hypothetical protein
MIYFGRRQWLARSEIERVAAALPQFAHLSISDIESELTKISENVRAFPLGQWDDIRGIHCFGHPTGPSALELWGHSKEEREEIIQWYSQDFFKKEILEFLAEKTGVFCCICGHIRPHFQAKLYQHRFYTDGGFIDWLIGCDDWRFAGYAVFPLCNPCNGAAERFAIRDLELFCNSRLNRWKMKDESQYVSTLYAITRTPLFKKRVKVNANAFVNARFDPRKPQLEFAA